MSEYNAVAPPQQFNKSQAFAAALLRAKQIAAKINPGQNPGSDTGTKRPLDEGSGGMDWTEPEAKKSSGSPPSRQNPQSTVQGMTGCVFAEDIKVPNKMVRLREHVTRLQSESGCKIQLAPGIIGTLDRICMTGNPQVISRTAQIVNPMVHRSYKTESGESPREEMLPDNSQHQKSSFVEMMIPGPKVGLVIGKGGETIKHLQEKSGAKMYIIQDGPNQESEKPLRITGESQKVDHAKALVYELLAENQARNTMNRGRGAGGRGGFGGGGGGKRPSGQQMCPPCDEAQYAVPSNKCGVIIGRGGETIKQIIQITGAHCELDRKPNSNPDEKIFLIRGVPEQIEAAKRMIAEKLGQGHGNFLSQQQWGPAQQPCQQPVDQNFAGVASAQATPQADYTQQWIEYYRSIGMHNQADVIEQQTKAKVAQAAPFTPQPSTQPQSNGGAPDYSTQWAQYYRNVGKMKEAELIEQEIKRKQTQECGAASGGSQPSPQFRNYYPGSSYYPGNQYPYTGYTASLQGSFNLVGEPQASARQ